MKMIGKFLKEEKGQGAIEYILLAGGIIASAVVIFVIYTKMTKTSAEKLENATGKATEQMNVIIGSKISEME